MAMFLLLYCPYRPETYSGHRITEINAPDFEDAKRQASDILKARWNSVTYEYRLVEITNDSHYRLHDTAKSDECWLVGGKY